jgi:TrmH family RNA methyltransferase
VVTCTAKYAIGWWRKTQIKTIAPSLHASQHYLDPLYPDATAVVLGTEAEGLSKEWTDAADERIIIPMRGIADSLNVSTSAAIVVFEILRQRLNAEKE